MMFKQWHFLFSVSLLFSFLSFKVTTGTNTSTTTINNSGFSLELIHIDNKHYEFYNRNLTDEERYQRLHDISDSRVKWLEKKTSTGTIPTTTTRGLLQLRPTLIANPYISQHFVKISIGTPAMTYYLVLDTGSNLLWTHCSPLQSNSNQDGPVFNPHHSSTYRKIPCTDRLCTRPRLKSVDNECVYTVTYVDKRITRGVLSQETITVGEDMATTIPNLAFGCSHNSQGFGDASSGLFGLGFEPVSFPSQLGIRKFSYCLPTSNTKLSYLQFDNDIPKPPGGRPRISSTSLIMSKGQGYRVQLLYISIRGHRLAIPRDTFQLNPSGGGCILDSGATFTYLIRPAYEIVKQEFINYFDMHSLVRATEDLRARTRFDVCYLWDSRLVVYWPKMVLHFQGADLTISGNQLFYAPSNLPIFCLALKSSDIFTLIGHFQQRGKRFIYNLADSQLEFYDEDCDLDHSQG